MSNYLENIFNIGLTKVISAPSKEEEDLKTKILMDNLFFENKLNQLTPKEQLMLLTELVNFNKNSLKEYFGTQFWKSFLNEGISKFNNDSAYIRANSKLYLLMLKIQSYHEEVDWYKILLTLKKVVIEFNYIPEFDIVLEWVIKSSPELFLKFMSSDLKKLSSKTRVNLYKRLIEEGLLDKMTARRIRSDSSGTLSCEVLGYLFLNRFRYSEEFYQELIMQFADTKHKWVARYLALNIPISLSPYLLGMTDKVSVKILEERFHVDDEGDV
jgi:hypothetical protein